jgi:hypothetical protein
MTRVTARWVLRGLICASVLAVQAGAKAGSESFSVDGISARRADADVLAYETLIAFRDSHPNRFYQNHHFFAHLLTDSAFMNAIEERWERHMRRIDYYVPYLGEILLGR